MGAALITRSLAIIPTAVYIGIRGANNVNDLIVLSQVVLALQLPFAMFPLLHLASSRKRMGQWRTRLVSTHSRVGFGVADYGLRLLRSAGCRETGLAGYHRRIN